MRIIKIRRRGRSGRVVVEVDDHEPPSFSLAEEVAVRAGLLPGRQLEPAELEALLGRDTEWRAREAALRLLSHRPRGAVELRRRLLSRGFPAEAVDGCLESLAGTGLVDDLEFALAFARSRVRSRPRSASVIAGELRARGVSDDIAAQALRHIFEDEGITEIDLARRVTARFVPRKGEDPRKRRRRLQMLLVRRGFQSDTIRQMVDELGS